MNVHALRALVVAFLLLASGVLAIDGGFEFESDKQQQLYNRLIVELRCLVCQNQNLADSNAELAKDLRRKSYEMITQGATYEEVIGYMEQRYGDFVLYRDYYYEIVSTQWARQLFGQIDHTFEIVATAYYSREGLFDAT